MPAERAKVSVLAQFTTGYSGVRLTLHNPKITFSLPSQNKQPAMQVLSLMLFGGLKTKVLISAGEGYCFFFCGALPWNEKEMGLWIQTENSEHG